MKKELVLVSCVFLLSLVLPITSVSATSVGKSCSKAGALAGTKENPLVCKKAGKKLIWRRNVTPSTTTTVAPTRTTTVAPTTTTTVAPTTTTTFAPTTTAAATTTTTMTLPVINGEIGLALNAKDGLTVTLISFNKIEMSASFQYKISYTLANNTQNKIAQGQFKLFSGSGQGLPQYGSFSDMFPGNTISRSYTFEELKSVSFTQLSYAPNQFFAKSAPAGAIVWQVP